MSTATTTVPADPDAVFRVITDIAGLPDWNHAITALVHAPGELVEGAEWVVELHAFGRSWHSRSELEHHDPAARRFAYRSHTDDGNPSWVHWQWSVDGHSAGAEVTVSWDLHPVTFWRRVLFARIRRRQLARREVPASLAALAEIVTAGLPQRAVSARSGHVARASHRP